MFYGNLKCYIQNVATWPGQILAFLTFHHSSVASPYTQQSLIRLTHGHLSSLAHQQYLASVTQVSEIQDNLVAGTLWKPHLGNHEVSNYYKYNIIDADNTT